MFVYVLLLRIRRRTSFVLEVNIVLQAPLTKQLVSSQLAQWHLAYRDSTCDTFNYCVALATSGLRVLRVPPGSTLTVDTLTK